MPVSYTHLVHYDENEDDRIALEENLEELSQLIAKGATPEKLQENDLAFHHLLGSCTTNPLLEQIYNIVIEDVYKRQTDC